MPPPGYRNLLTVKGIALVMAAVFVTEIGDIAADRPVRCAAGRVSHRATTSRTRACTAARSAKRATQRSAGPWSRRSGPRPEPAVKAVRDAIVARRGQDRPQHRQGRRRPPDARGRVLRTARRPSPLSGDQGRSMGDLIATMSVTGDAFDQDFVQVE